jgi:hypothetical protein
MLRKNLLNDGFEVPARRALVIGKDKQRVLGGDVTDRVTFVDDNLPFRLP